MQYIISATPADPPANYYNVVTQGGAHADDSTDDYQHILDAVTFANNPANGYDGVYFPAGTYLITGNSGVLGIDAGTTLVGAGLATTHIKGGVRVNSNSSFSDLKIGNTGGSIRNDNQSANTDSVQFTRCQFRGGSGGWGDYAGVVAILDYATNWTFTGCNIERHQGDGSGHHDNLYIQCETVAPSVHDILFTGCDFGVSNGVATGCPRYNHEMYAKPENAVRTASYYNIDFESCHFYSAVGDVIDYCGCAASSDGTTPLAGNSHVWDCDFEGSHLPQIDIESLLAGIEVKRCTFKKCDLPALVIGNNVASAYPLACTIEDNTFDFTQANAYTPADPEMVRITGSGSSFSGNTILNPYGSAAKGNVSVHVLGSASGNYIESNTITHDPATGTAVLLDATSTGNYVRYNAMTGADIDDNGTGNTVTPNP